MISPGQGTDADVLAPLQPVANGLMPGAHSLRIAPLQLAKAGHFCFQNLPAAQNCRNRSPFFSLF